MESSKKIDNSKTFAKGFCFEKYFWIFIIGSIFGCYYEQILYLITNYLNTGTIVWELRRGVIYGPFSPVYGWGALLFTYVFTKNNLKWWQYILYGGLVGGILEYGISFLQETFMGTISWDYSNYFLNINGRTTIPYMFFWGLLALIYSIYIYPIISNTIEKIPYNFAKILTKICIIIICIDMLISWTALFRQTLRSKNIQPITFIGKIYDKYYTDDFLKKYFVNMRRTN